MAELETWRPEVDAMVNMVIGSTKVLLDGDSKSCRRKECNLGNLISDAMIDYVSVQLPRIQVTAIGKSDLIIQNAYFSNSLMHRFSFHEYFIRRMQNNMLETMAGPTQQLLFTMVDRLGRLYAKLKTKR